MEPHWTETPSGKKSLSLLGQMMTREQFGVLPSPPELNNERNTGDSENQDTGGDNPEGGRGDAEDGGTDARSGSTLARSVLTIRSILISHNE